MRGEVRKLTTITRFEHFNEHATLVTILGDFVSEAVLGQVADIGGIQCAYETSPHGLGDQVVATGLECMKVVCDFANTGSVLRRDFNSALTRVLATQGFKEAPDHVIDVDQIDPCCPVIYLNGQVSGNVVAECCHCRVVVWPRPFAKHIGQAE
ncbi:hypothetical protein D3C76_1337490 [compost metagenome]